MPMACEVDAFQKVLPGSQVAIKGAKDRLREFGSIIPQISTITKWVSKSANLVEFLTQVCLCFRVNSSDSRNRK